MGVFDTCKHSKILQHSNTIHGQKFLAAGLVPCLENIRIVRPGATDLQLSQKLVLTLTHLYL